LLGSELFADLLKLFVEGSAFALGIPSAAWAVESKPPGNVDELVSGQSEKQWQAALELYGWLPGFDGHANINGYHKEIDFPLSEVLDHLDMTLMLKGAVRYDRFAVMADYVYLKMSGNSIANGPLPIQEKIVMKMSLLNLIGTYRVWESDRAFVELGGGLRYLHLNTSLSLACGNRSRFDETSGSIVNGVGAVRGGYRWNPKWSARGYFDIGAGDSDLTWMANLDVSYNLTEQSALVLGYQYLRFDMSNSADNIELNVNGPYLGFVYKF
jgi:hypothetical protein